MAQEIFKAAAMARDLEQRLQLAGLSATITKGQDAENWPTLLVSKGAADDDDQIALVIKADGNAGRVDGIGLAQAAYTPHRVNIALSDDTQEPTTVDQAMRLRVTVECTKTGAEVEIRSKDGKATEADLEAAAWDLLDKVTVIRSSEINPLTEQM